MFYTFIKIEQMNFEIVYSQANNNINFKCALTDFSTLHRPKMD